MFNGKIDFKKIRHQGRVTKLQKDITLINVMESRWWSKQKAFDRFTPVVYPVWPRSQHDTCDMGHVTVFLIKFHREMCSLFCTCQQAIVHPHPLIKIVGVDFFWQLATPVLIYFISEKCLCPLWQMEIAWMCWYDAVNLIKLSFLTLVVWSVGKN